MPSTRVYYSAAARWCRMSTDSYNVICHVIERRPTFSSRRNFFEFHFNPMGTGGLFRPRVIKMLAISKPMIQLPWFFLTFPQLMNTTGLLKKFICTLVKILCFLILFYVVSRLLANDATLHIWLHSLSALTNRLQIASDHLWKIGRYDFLVLKVNVTHAGNHCIRSVPANFIK